MTFLPVFFFDFVCLFGYLRKGYFVYVWLSFVDQAHKYCEFKDLPASASQVLGLKDCTITIHPFLSFLCQSSPTEEYKLCLP